MGWPEVVALKAGLTVLAWLSTQAVVLAVLPRDGPFWSTTLRRLAWLAVLCIRWQLWWALWICLSVMAEKYAQAFLGLLDATPIPRCSLSGGVASNTTGIQVLLPSVGHTGLTSVVHALREMGYRSFHVEEKMTFMPAIHPDRQQAAEEFAGAISRCKVEAMVLESDLDILPAILEVSPEAKVIMTWRVWYPWWRSLENRFKEGPWMMFKILLAQPLRFFTVPAINNRLFGGALWRALQEARPLTAPGTASWASYVVYLHALREHWFETGHAERGEFKIDGDEEPLLAHQDEIRRLAAGRLLEFDVTRHGWAELSEFLGRPVPHGNLTFPHAKARSTWTNDEILSQNMRVVLPVLGLCAVLTILAVAATRATVLSALRRLARK